MRSGAEKLGLCRGSAGTWWAEAGRAATLSVAQAWAQRGVCRLGLTVRADEALLGLRVDIWSAFVCDRQHTIFLLLIGAYVDNSCMLVRVNPCEPALPHL